MDKKAVTKLIEDLEFIHESVGESLKEMDDKVISAIHASENGNITEPQLEATRFELWSIYTQDTISIINEMLKELAKALVQVKNYRVRVNRQKREFNRIGHSVEFETAWISTKPIDNMKSLFVESTRLWNELVDIEPDLRSEAWKNFLIKVYLPFATMGTGAYWYIMTQIQPFKLTTENVFGFIFILIVIYFVLRHLLLNPPKEADEEE